MANQATFSGATYRSCITQAISSGWMPETYVRFLGPFDNADFVPVVRAKDDNPAESIEYLVPVTQTISAGYHLICVR